MQIASTLAPCQNFIQVAAPTSSLCGLAPSVSRSQAGRLALLAAGRDRASKPRYVRREVALGTRARRQRADRQRHSAGEVVGAHAQPAQCGQASERGRECACVAIRIAMLVKSMQPGELDAISCDSNSKTAYSKIGPVLPVSELLLRSSVVSAVRRLSAPSSAGIGPRRRLPSRNSSVRLRSRPSSGGIDPSKALSASASAESEAS